MSFASARDVADFRRRALIRLLAATPYDGGDPLETWADNTAVWEVFADRDDLLVALHELWVDLLSHRIFSEPSYPLGPDRLCSVYGRLAEEQQTLRAALDHHEDEAALSAGLLEEHVLLARAAGHLDVRTNASTLAWRARDLLATIPAQRTPDQVVGS